MAQKRCWLPRLSLRPVKACRDGCSATKERYLEILEFTHYSRVLSFDETDTGRRKNIEKGFTVVVAIAAVVSGDTINNEP